MSFHTREKKKGLGDLCITLICVLLSRLHWLVVKVVGPLFVCYIAIVRRISAPGKLGLMLSILGGMFIWIGLIGIKDYPWLMSLTFETFKSSMEIDPVHIKILRENGLYDFSDYLSYPMIGVGFYACLMAVIGYIPMTIVYWLQRICSLALACATLVVLYFFVKIPSVLLENMMVGKTQVFDKEGYQLLLVVGIWMLVPMVAIVILYILTTFMSSTRLYYRAKTAEQNKADIIADGIVTGGDDPRFRSSMRWAVFLYILVLFIIPLLYFIFYGMDPYAIPKGSGAQTPTVVKMVKPKKKPKQKMLFNPNSAISFIRPDIDDFSEVMDEAMVETENTYETASLQKGKLGKGGGKKGGWPNGMENAKVRFIRLEYSGGDWDQNMGKGSDYNFLVKFKELTGFNIADNTESVKIYNLKRFPKHRAPPFVYITGMGAINVSSSDIKVLRWYLKEEAGMIFADNGGGSFDRSFRSLMRRVFPDGKWIDIANDDILYRQPYLFPNGAPPLWHHSGTRAMGMRAEDGRWMVFYHQGDINDAWQDGNNGVSEAVRMSAYRMGVNVVNYAFNVYLSVHFGDK